jgi:hypothetical protein
LDRRHHDHQPRSTCSQRRWAATGSTNERSPGGPSRGGAWQTGPEDPPRLGVRRSSIPRKPGDCGDTCEPYGRPPTLSPARRGTGERSPCDASREGHLAATHCPAPSTRPAALVDPPETGGLRKKPVNRTDGHTRGLPLGGGPASVLPGTEPRGHLADRTSAWPTPQTGTAAARGHQSRDRPLAPRG